MTPQTGQQVITIRILRNISRSKCNQTMKFGQLLGYNREIFVLANINVFLEKSYTKCDGEASPRVFDKKSKLSVHLNQQSEML